MPLNTIRLGLQAVEPGGVADTSSHACMSEAVRNMSDVLNDVLSYQTVSANIYFPLLRALE